MEQNFALDKKKIFAYNKNKKFKFYFVLFILFFLLPTLILSYIFFLRNSDIMFIQIIEQFVLSIISEIGSGSLQGAFLASLVTGFFLVSIPPELLFLNFAGKHPFFLLTIVFVSGMLISFTINYFIGLSLKEPSKKLIGIGKFYKLKVLLNNYGDNVILLFNMLPLPAQPLSVVLGVFKYDRTRFLLFAFIGQTIKYLSLTIILILI